MIYESDFEDIDTENESIKEVPSVSPKQKKKENCTKNIKMIHYTKTQSRRWKNSFFHF